MNTSLQKASVLLVLLSTLVSAASFAEVRVISGIYNDPNYIHFELSGSEAKALYSTFYDNASTVNFTGRHFEAPGNSGFEVLCSNEISKNVIMKHFDNYQCYGSITLSNEEKASQAAVLNQASNNLLPPGTRISHKIYGNNAIVFAQTNDIGKLIASESDRTKTLTGAYAAEYAESIGNNSGLSFSCSAKNGLVESCEIAISREDNSPANNLRP